MKKLAFIIIIVLIVFTLHCYSETLTIFKDLTKPSFLSVDKNHIYVIEKAKIYLFRIDDFKKVLEFGREGEGPGEFKLTRSKKGVTLYPSDDMLFTNSIGKISWWSMEGKLIKEFKTKSGSTISRYLPLGDLLVGMVVVGSSEGEKLSFNLEIFNKDFKKLKTLTTLNFVKKGRLQFPFTRPTFSIWGGEYFCTGSE